MKLIDKDAALAEIKKLEKLYCYDSVTTGGRVAKSVFISINDVFNTLEVKEVDIDKLCEFRKSVGFADTGCASEYQKQLACYRQGIKDVIKALKGE